MPRNLARLRYRLPPAPVTFDGPARLLERRVARFVVRQSNPRLVRLQTVVNPKAKPLATGKAAVRPIKPFTLRDLVDPTSTAPHGQILYVFRSIKTNQVIYSLQELLDDHHRAQLPFIGKHSVPPALRPDEWIPHAVVAFPSPAQGRNAFRQLREFRKLHELSWAKTNPGWAQLKREHRIKKIMDQRANTAADLAEVLRIQHVHGADMTTAAADHERSVAACMDSKWAGIHALADAAAAAAKPADNVTWLQNEIARLSHKLNMKHKQSPADQAALTAARASHETRLKRIEYAVRKSAQLKAHEADLTAIAAPALEPDASSRLTQLRNETAILRDALSNPDPTRSPNDLALDADLLASQTAALTTLEAAFAAHETLTTRAHHIPRSVLPGAMKTPPPTPYTLSGVRVLWADLQDALHAAGQWPEVIEHEVLPVNQARDAAAFLSAEEYEVEKRNEVRGILQALRPQTELSEEVDSLQMERESEKQEQKTGVLGMLGRVNPFKSANA